LRDKLLYFFTLPTKFSQKSLAYKLLINIIPDLVSEI